ncbi:eotaxin-like [Acanthopagrus latus]|uniref:eotaxin-like n=1 Tax=Acanthopagrus latus TaxID=8177 RepID=UPI00187CAA89|nr:eotaxin-like [Acanthopagrus latus]
MKTLLTFALLALIGLLHHNSAGPVGPASIKRSCCPNVRHVPVPIQMIRDVERSHSKCLRSSIILTTVCGRKFCLDGNSAWVKKLLAYFEKSTANKKSPSARLSSSLCRN